MIGSSPAAGTAATAATYETDTVVFGTLTYTAASTATTAGHTVTPAVQQTVTFDGVTVTATSHSLTATEFATIFASHVAGDTPV